MIQTYFIYSDNDFRNSKCQKACVPLSRIGETTISAYGGAMWGKHNLDTATGVFDKNKEALSISNLLKEIDEDVSKDRNYLIAWTVSERPTFTEWITKKGYYIYDTEEDERVIDERIILR